MRVAAARDGRRHLLRGGLAGVRAGDDLEDVVRRQERGVHLDNAPVQGVPQPEPLRLDVVQRALVGVYIAVPCAAPLSISPWLGTKRGGVAREG